ncbi:hypothetical protein Smp_145480 [Schistosoma mansoni]|uniref:hypothetical protein n=1 Tax=Schistosoma mansoni TaxID=6183 RepID=UPI0001A641EA|nr:hypothetical protein Smp_145480 [Schistosoma mansoni]|eukprot:XP_018651972.1 hypothetical protein Smp_145480 [Schistosoma mansoni]
MIPNLTHGDPQEWGVVQVSQSEDISNHKLILDRQKTASSTTRLKSTTYYQSTICKGNGSELSKIVHELK